MANCFNLRLLRQIFSFKGVDEAGGSGVVNGDAVSVGKSADLVICTEGDIKAVNYLVEGVCGVFAFNSCFFFFLFLVKVRLNGNHFVLLVYGNCLEP